MKVIKTKTSLKESSDIDSTVLTASPKAGMAAILNSLIIDEYEAIDGYNSAMVTASEEGFTEVARLLADIQAEENIHVGQLQEALKLFDPNTNNIEVGQEEGEEQLSSL